MNLADVMDEVAAVAKEISKLRVTAYPAESITPPAGYVSYPQAVAYDETYGRGVDKYTGLPITMLAGAVVSRAARDTVARWANGSGVDSFKALMEAHTWKSCDDVTVTGCTFDVETVGGVDYLAVVFTADVIGRGA